MVAMAVTAKAAPRLAGSNVSRMMDCWLGWSPPPKKPCARRKITSCANDCEMPQRKEHTVNMAMQMMK